MYSYLVTRKLAMSASVFSPSSSWSYLERISNVASLALVLTLFRLIKPSFCSWFYFLVDFVSTLGRFLAIAESMTTYTVVRVHRDCLHPVSKPSRTRIQRHLTSHPQVCVGNSDHKLQYIMQHTACSRQWGDMCVGSFFLVLNASSMLH